MNYLEKLDWDMYLNELSTVWGPTYTEGLGQTAPVAPPPPPPPLCVELPYVKQVAPIMCLLV